MTGRAASAVCMQTISTVWIQTIDHSYFPQTHTQTQLWHTPIPKHPPRQRHIKKKTTAFWRHACRRKVAGFQCHSLRSGKHSTGRTLLSEIKVCSFSSGNWMKTEVQNVLCLSGVVFCARQTPRSEQIWSLSRALLSWERWNTGIEAVQQIQTLRGRIHNTLVYIGPTCEKLRNYCEYYNNPILWNRTNFQKLSWMSTLRSHGGLSGTTPASFSRRGVGCIKMILAKLQQCWNPG